MNPTPEQCVQALLAAATKNNPTMTWQEFQAVQKATQVLMAFIQSQKSETDSNAPARTPGETTGA